MIRYAVMTLLEYRFKATDLSAGLRSVYRSIIE